MAITRDSIETLVKEGLVPDIFAMDQAHVLFMAIAGRAKEINSQDNLNFGELFYVIQRSLRTEMLLAVARVYDRPNKKYPTRCLLGLLNYLECAGQELPTIREPIQLRMFLTSINAPTTLIETIATTPADFASCLGIYFREQLKAPSIIVALDSAKYYRDKFVAHNEDVGRVPFPNMSSLKELIDIAKNIVGALGWAYFGTAYIIEGRYLLFEDAQRAANAMTRLLNTVYGEE